MVGKRVKKVKKCLFTPGLDEFPVSEPRDPRRSLHDDLHDDLFFWLFPFFPPSTLTVPNPADWDRRPTGARTEGQVSRGAASPVRCASSKQAHGTTYEPCSRTQPHSHHVQLGTPRAISASQAHTRAVTSSSHGAHIDVLRAVVALRRRGPVVHRRVAPYRVTDGLRVHETAFGRICVSLSALKPSRLTATRSIENEGTLRPHDHTYPPHRRV